MYLGMLLILIFVACFASLMNSGLWSNALTLINVILSGLLATNYFEPLADFFDKMEPSFTYVWDFFAIWLIFGVSMILLRSITDYLSRIKVKFFLPVEKVGGIVMACWAGWIVVCFATMTLHAAPLARNFLDGAFQPKPDSRMFFGLGPDQFWLGWVHRESGGPLSRLGGIAEFDPQGEFVLKYGNRRDEFEKQLSLTKAKGGGSGAPTVPLPGFGQ
jgi:hypothetical protein